MRSFGQGFLLAQSQLNVLLTFVAVGKPEAFSHAFKGLLFSPPCHSGVCTHASSDLPGVDMCHN